MLIRIVGTGLPGSSCHPAGAPAYTNIHVGVQRRNRPEELLDLQRGDAESVTWTLECSVDGADVRGPYVQGGPGARFVYLSWGTVDDAGTFAMFRRAKLMLADVPTEVMAAATVSGVLEARLGLTDATGNPVCARVKPPAIRWTAESQAGTASRSAPSNGG
ncbi:DUF5990 family protein [Nocardia sp. NPDC058497]|uniref:DUF5990 family protein n=1 Tax=Nocardia sp. NPDC058497 TaxID=3346529 RepID=UPI00365EEA0B